VLEEGVKPVSSAHLGSVTNKSYIVLQIESWTVFK